MAKEKYGEEDLLWMDTLYKEGKAENDKFVESKLQEEFGDLIDKADREKVDQMNTLNTSPVYRHQTEAEREQAKASVESAYNEKLVDYNARKNELDTIYDNHLETSVYEQYDLTREDAVSQLDFIHSQNEDNVIEPETDSNISKTEDLSKEESDMGIEGDSTYDGNDYDSDTLHETFNDAQDHDIGGDYE